MYKNEDSQKSAYYIRSLLAALYGIVAVAMGFCYLPDAVNTMKMADGKKQPLCQAEGTDRKVSLSFDTAGSIEDTDEILEILKEEGIKAAFFMTGSYIDTYPEKVKAIAEAGHDLGNHSENHLLMSQLSLKECGEEIMKPHEKVKKLTGEEMTLFRPPYGAYSDTVMKAAKKAGYDVVLWNCDSLDWKNYGIDSIINETVNNKNLSGGSIILMHNGAPHTKDALPKIIEGIQDKGFEFVPISKLLSLH